MSPVVLKAMKKGNLKSFVSGERSRALWALLLLIQCNLCLKVFSYGMYKSLFPTISIKCVGGPVDQCSSIDRPLFIFARFDPDLTETYFSDLSNMDFIFYNSNIAG